ncbi:amidase domain-containing protein [Alicyclobacillus herbarius]|uniref:amidase domain-containing protein n=1 Tax=Alicyclobacillus herbarius TaxID=122960 RepID=UPI0003FF859F|nr:amidase domain-containing protein [Alicyclobacillus herbarius]
MSNLTGSIQGYMEERNRYWLTGDLDALARYWAEQAGENWKWIKLGWERRRQSAQIRRSRLLRAHSRVRVNRWRPLNTPEPTDGNLGGNGESTAVDVEMEESVNWVYRDGMEHAVEGRIIRHLQRWQPSPDGTWRIVSAQESDETGMGPNPVVSVESDAGLDADAAGIERPQTGLRSLVRRFMRPACNTYDRLQALRYAELWWNRPNPQYVYFRLDDCTNFVSQCLYSAGVPMHDTGNRASGWWYRFNDSGEDTWSFSWSTAHALYLYLTGQVQASVRSSAQELKIGDLVFYDWQGQGRFGHCTIVVDFDQKGDPLVNAHTDPSYHRHYLYLDSRAWTPQTRYAFVHLPQRVC